MSAFATALVLMFGSLAGSLRSVPEDFSSCSFALVIHFIFTIYIILVISYSPKLLLQIIRSVCRLVGSMVMVVEIRV